MKKSTTTRKLNRDELIKSLDPENLTKADVQAFRDRYRNDPVLFCSEILGLELDKNQVDIAESLRDNKRVVCVSARGCGKSVVICALSIWYFTMNPGAKVLLVANTSFQVSTVLWTKTSELINGSPISKWFDVNADFIYWKNTRDLGFITKLTASVDKVESVSGFHAPHLLYLIDESSAVPDKIILNLLASCTEDDNRMVLTTNPTRNTGFTHDKCDTPGWHTIHISGFDSAFTNKEHLREMVADYGEDSDVCRVQVFGKFPKNNTNVLITSDQMERCLSTRPHEGDTVVGIDVAASGTDLSVWCVRRGGEILAFIEESSSTVESLVENTIHIVDQYRVDRIFVDSTGLGWTLPDILRKNIPAIDIQGINFSSKPLNQQYFNMRSWMYYNAAQAIKNGEISMNLVKEKLPRVKEEFSNTEIYINNHGQFQLISKEQIKGLIGRSPDTADALALTFATDVPWSFVKEHKSMEKLDRSLYYAGLWS